MKQCVFPCFRNNEHAPLPLHEERKFIVFESSLDELLWACPVCAQRCTGVDKRVRGTMLYVERICKNQHVSAWASQPKIQMKAAGNVLVPAAALYSGCSISKFLRALKSIGIVCPSYRYHFAVQKALLVPAITMVCDIFLFYR